MRIALAVIAAVSGVAHADGAYVVGDGGGTVMRGDLAGYGPAIRYRAGVGLALGDWAVEGWYAGDRGDMMPFGETGCVSPPGGACPVGGGGFGPSTGSLTSYGVDLRRAFTLVEGHPTEPRGKWMRPRLQAFLHAGLRDARGDGGMRGLSGSGFGAGAGLDLNVRVFSVYLDLGADRYDFGDGMGNAQTFHVVLGERIGFSM